MAWPRVALISRVVLDGPLHAGDHVRLRIQRHLGGIALDVHGTAHARHHHLDRPAARPAQLVTVALAEQIFSQVR